MSRWRVRTKLLASVLVGAGFLCAQVVRPGPSVPAIPEKLGLMIAMRDGVRLSANVFLPRGSGRWPAVLFRTPYDPNGPSSRSYRGFIQRGYAVVIEEVRGRYASEGEFGRVEQEGPDASDTISWIARQPWSSNQVVMGGTSYGGIVQWWAATANNPHLVAIAPMFSGDDDYLDRFYSTGGALKLGHRLLWLAQNLTPPGQVRPLFSSYIDHLPLRTADVAATGWKLPIWRTVLDHPSYDSYWRARSIRLQAGRINVPVLSIGGWFDNYAPSDLDMFGRLAEAHREVETWIGPWGHNPGLEFPTRAFGAEAKIPIRGRQADWFDRWLHRTPALSEAKLPLLHIFVMGPDIWREEHEWPLARTRYTPFYLASSGHANTRAGDGALLRNAVRKASPDTFTYDPRDPVPTVGGAICCDPRTLPPGPLEQTAVETRPDVLVYTSAPLREEIEVTGPVKALLYVSTSANDTDFSAKLVDVQADGRALAVCDGIQRMRYRLSLNNAVFVKRNATYQLTVDAGVTSYVFAKSHRIRLEVSSSNFPHFDRNLNSAGPNADVTKIVKAKQTVFHEKNYPSALILPVIPKHGS